MSTTRRILTGLLAAAAVTLAVSAPALAHGPRHGWWHHGGYYGDGYYGRGGYGRGYYGGPDVVVVRPRPRVYVEPAPVYVERPPVYYERPPVYYAPPPPRVYAPAPSISVNIPLGFD